MLRNEPRSDAEIALILGCNRSTIQKIRVGKKRSLRDRFIHAGFFAIAHLSDDELEVVLNTAPELKKAGRPKKY